MINRYVIYNPQGATEGHSRQYSTNLCNGLAENRIQVNLVTSRDFDASDIMANGVNITYTAINNSRKRTVKYDSWVSKLRYGAFIVSNNIRSLLVLNETVKKEFNACVLIGGETATNILYLLITCWRKHSVLALTIHNADYDGFLYRDNKVKLIYKLISKVLLKILTRTSVVIFVHGEAMREVLARQIGVRQDRISIYKVPVRETDLVSSNATRRPDCIRLLFCGVIRQDKGFDILCEALSKCTTSAHWRLRIAGSAKQVGDEYVYALTEKYAIDRNCSYNMKYLSSSELDHEFRNADIVVLPYRRGFIAQSVVMTDAIRLRRPVIVTEHSQNGYDTQRYQLGWVFESENVDSLAGAINVAIEEISSGMQKFEFNEYIKAHSPSNVVQCIVRCASNVSKHNV